MDNFDSFAQDFSPASTGKAKPGNYGWHSYLTILSFLLVGGLSFLMAYLTKDVPDRPIWMVGLIFMVPACAMFLSAMLMEFSLGAMTPSTSRSAQIKVAVAATLATMVVGCVFDAVYLYGGFVGESSDNLLFLVYEDDVSGNSSTDQAVMQVLDDLIDRAGDKVEAGLFVFDTSNDDNTVVPLAPFTRDQRQKMYRALIEGQKDQHVEYGIQEAYQMVEERTNDKPTRIIIISDLVMPYGTPESEQDSELTYLKDNQISLNMMGRGESDDVTYYLVDQTGGKIINDYNAANFLDSLRTITRKDGDMIRSDTASANILTGIMLLLEGLVIGFGLMLLLSLRGQKRFQVILSPLMAGLAYLVLKVLPLDSVDQWIREGIAFSLLGLVFMTRNFTADNGNTVPVPAVSDYTAASPAPADDEWG